MDNDKALELFSLHAFNNVSPPDSHQRLSREVVSTTGGLPLALEVIGSYLRRKGEKIWEEMLERLKKASHNQVQDKLKISYDALTYREKEIFLDIACFFINEKRSMATYFWDACDLSPHIALEELTDLCLIKIVNGDAIWMHDQLRDLGRDIVRQECTHNLTGLSRLWNSEEALEVVRSKERKDKVKALDLVGHYRDSITIVDEELEKMPNLKFLKLSAATFGGDVNNYLMELRWLFWDSPTLDRRMTDLHLKNLAIFELSCCENTKNWGGWKILKMAKKLKVLSVSRCNGLKRTPDFSGCLSLERLSIVGCPNLQEVDSSIGKLKRLTHLDIIRCESLRTLPEEIGGLVHLKHFSIQECSKMEKLPYSIGKLASLFELDISRTQIRSLPDSIGNSRHLSSLDLSHTPIMELPSSIGELMQLEFLSLSSCKNLGELPESIGNLASLQDFDISETKIVELTDSIKNLKKLKVMKMQLSEIRRLPASIGTLERLEELYAWGCGQLAGELPIEIGGLSSLRILDVSYTGVCAVPTTINSLTRLQKLNLMDCDELQELPKLPPSLNCLRVESRSLRVVSDLGNLTNLVELHLARSLQVVPDLGNLTNLVELHLARLLRVLSYLGTLTNLMELHLANGGEIEPTQASNPMQILNLQGVGKLFKLEKLRLCLSNARVPSTDLGCLLQLRELTLSNMDSLDSVIFGPQFTDLKSLSKLCLHGCPLREIQLDGLEQLRDLAVEDCDFLEGFSIISSSMRKLNYMKVSGCPELLEIRFLSAMESLESIVVGVCRSLGGLGGLSNVKKLKFLHVFDCNGLRVIGGLEESKLLGYLGFMGCRSLEISNVSNFKIPNECRMNVFGCSKLLDTVLSVVTFENYREMILGRMAETFDKEDEMEKDSENKTRKRTASKDSETFNKEDEMEKDTENKTRKRTTSKVQRICKP